MYIYEMVIISCSCYRVYTQAFIQRDIHIYTCISHLHFSTYMHRVQPGWMYALKCSSTAQCSPAMCCFSVWKCFLNQNDIIRSPNVLWYYPYNALCICVSYFYRIIILSFKIVVFHFFCVGFILSILPDQSEQLLTAANRFRVIDNKWSN